MIKSILRKVCSPVQVVVDITRRKYRDRLMMSYALKNTRSKNNNKQATDLQECKKCRNLSREQR